MTDLSGLDISRYHLVEQLGQGGMAVVYRAYDTRLEREVAVKLIRMENFAPNVVDQMLTRFEREARSLAKLMHPNIIPIFDYGEYEGSPYLVMPYISGGTLKQRTGKPMPYQEAARILAPIARALEYAHQREIIHRDVKPANILISENGIPLLSDFGVAKILEVESGNTLTGTGTGIGTPEYMPPEQWENKVEPRTDIYALGVVLYELVTGRKPFTADTPAAILRMVYFDPLPRPKQFVPDLPDEVENVIFKAMAKKVEDRYATGGELAAALERLAYGLPASLSAPGMDQAVVETQPGLSGSALAPEYKTTIKEDALKPAKDTRDQTTQVGGSAWPTSVPAPVYNYKSPKVEQKTQPPPVSSRISWKWLILAGAGLAISMLALCLGLFFSSQGFGLPVVMLSSTSTRPSTVSLSTSQPRQPSGTLQPAATALPTSAPVVAQIPPAALSQQGSLLICADFPFPPQEYFDNTGNPQGLDVEIGNEIAARLGLNAQWVNTPYDTINTSLKSGKCDIILSAQTITSERQKQVSMIPYLQAGMSFLAPKGNPNNINGPLDVCGKPVAALSDSIEIDYLKGSGSYTGNGLAQQCEKAGQKTPDVVTTPKDSDGLTSLQANKVIALLTDSISAGYYTLQYPDRFQVVGELIDPSFEGISATCGQADCSTAPLSQAGQAVKTALQSMVNDGSYLKILTRWHLANAAVPVP